jgi:hypothetical protein
MGGYNRRPPTQTASYRIHKVRQKSTRFAKLSRSHRLQNGIGKLRRAARATHIAGQAFAFGVHGLQCLLDFIRRCLLNEMVQHQYR